MNSLGDLENKKFQKALWVSLALHLIVLLFFVFFSGWQKIQTPPETKVTWVKLGGGAGKEEAPFIKKSTALPQTTIEQQKNSTLEQPQAPKVEKIAKPKPEMAPKDQVVVKDKKDLKTQTIQKQKEVVEKRTDVKAGPKDTRIQDALAKINNDLNERKALPE
ncbi:MAG: hypothetical protein JNK65_08385, partial [Deltaproteobacteria bacterium]|nr:hypothetical protein [Deltaproteobacteria bacterium]